MIGIVKDKNSIVEGEVYEVDEWYYVKKKDS